MIEIVSPGWMRPLSVPFVSAIVIGTGRARSAGARAVKDPWLPAASRTPLPEAVSATVIPPTAVFAAPAPSEMASVTVLVATATEAALQAMNITLEQRRAEADEDEIEIKGDDGSRKVVVDIEGNRDAGQTHIYVSVSKNAVDYDKSRADEILRAIVARLQ